MQCAPRTRSPCSNTFFHRQLGEVNGLHVIATSGQQTTLYQTFLIPPPSNFRSSGHKVVINAVRFLSIGRLKPRGGGGSSRQSLRWHVREAELSWNRNQCCPVLGEGQKGFGSVLQALKCLDKGKGLQGTTAST